MQIFRTFSWCLPGVNVSLCRTKLLCVCDSSFRKHCKFHQIHAKEIDLCNIVAVQISGHLPVFAWFNCEFVCERQNSVLYMTVLSDIAISLIWFMFANLYIRYIWHGSYADCKCKTVQWLPGVNVRDETFTFNNKKTWETESLLSTKRNKNRTKMLWNCYEWYQRWPCRFKCNNFIVAPYKFYLVLSMALTSWWVSR